MLPIHITKYINPKRSIPDKSDNNAYIGFMYGVANSDKFYTMEGTDLTGEHDNINDSTILSNLKSWYNTSIIGNNLDKYLADVIWCGDKSISSGNGIGKNGTYYSSSNRVSNNPKLICPNLGTDGKLSKYTANDITNGNGSLNGYKIGLLTVDEVIFSGGKNKMINNNWFLSFNNYTSWWTMSPSRFAGGDAYVWLLDHNKVSSDHFVRGYNTSMRPSIALIPSITISDGTGTINNPYVIDET